LSGSGTSVATVLLPRYYNGNLVTAYALLDKTFGNKVYNEDRQWSFGDFMTSDAQQNGKSVGDAHPIGYYWRAAAPESGAGEPLTRYPSWTWTYCEERHSSCGARRPRLKHGSTSVRNRPGVRAGVRAPARPAPGEGPSPSSGGNF
jgi:hypothetical protein